MSDFEEPPKWLMDPEVKAGILLAQTIVSCRSEKQRLVAEQRNLCCWIYSEVAVTCVVSEKTLLLGCRSGLGYRKRRGKTP